MTRELSYVGLEAEVGSGELDAPPSLGDQHYVGVGVGVGIGIGIAYSVLVRLRLQFWRAGRRSSLNPSCHAFGRRTLCCTTDGRSPAPRRPARGILAAGHLGLIGGERDQKWKITDARSKREKGPCVFFPCTCTRPIRVKSLNHVRLSLNVITLINSPSTWVSSPH